MLIGRMSRLRSKGHFRTAEPEDQMNPTDKRVSTETDLCLYMMRLLFQTFYLWERNCVCKLGSKKEALVYGNEEA